jgi:hypothetical protein
MMRGVAKIEMLQDRWAVFDDRLNYLWTFPIRLAHGPCLFVPSFHPAGDFLTLLFSPRKCFLPFLKCLACHECSLYFVASCRRFFTVAFEPLENVANTPGSLPALKRKEAVTLETASALLGNSRQS